MSAADEKTLYFVHFSLSILEVMNIAMTARKVIVSAVRDSDKTRLVDCRIWSRRLWTEL